MFGLIFKSAAAILTLAGGASHRDFKVADLAFMAGSWEGKLQGATLEETWLAPKAGSLLGMMREDLDGKTAIREFEVIEETPEGVMMTIKHFNAKMEELPGRMLSRKLVTLKVDEATFESTGPEPKQKLTYRKNGKDGLFASIELTRNGQPVRLDIPMTRVGLKADH
ncbi:MAG: DUF6265 family protein [Chthonomonadales bacterium]